MSRVFAIVGALVFLSSLVYFGLCYARYFGAEQPWSWEAAWRPLLINLSLFTAFALHHSVFARTPVKTWITRHVPAELERSVYVWIASVLFIVVCAAWQPVPGTLWRGSGGVASVLAIVQIASTLFVLDSARRLDTLALAGVRQAFGGHAVAGPPAPPTADSLLETGPYALVRHPIYLGWFVLVWGAPEMNGTRAAFAAMSCLYLVLAMPFEERDLRRTFGDAYARYQARVRWRVLPGLH